MMWMGRCGVGLVLALIAGGLGGCGQRGPAVGSVEGQITFQTQPIGEGLVVFENAEQGLAYVAPLAADGRYRLAAVQVADYKVCIKPPDAKVADETSGNPVGVIPMSQAAQPNPANIPADFRTSQSTPLKATVGEGVNQFNYDLAKP